MMDGGHVVSHFIFMSSNKRKWGAISSWLISAVNWCCFINLPGATAKYAGSCLDNLGQTPMRRGQRGVKEKTNNWQKAADQLLPVGFARGWKTSLVFVLFWLLKQQLIMNSEWCNDPTPRGFCALNSVWIDVRLKTHLTLFLPKYLPMNDPVFWSFSY